MRIFPGMTLRAVFLLSFASLFLVEAFVLAAPTQERRQIQVREAALRTEPREMCLPHATLNYADPVDIETTDKQWSKIKAVKNPEQQGWLYSEVLTTTTLYAHMTDAPKGVKPTKGTRIGDKGLGDPSLTTAFLNTNPDVSPTDFKAIDEMESAKVAPADVVTFIKAGGPSASTEN